MKILVLCTGNSARSILLECLLNRLGAGRIQAFSAGSQPTGAVHPQALDILANKGFDITGLRSKTWDDFAAADAPEMDLVITVCGSAAAETCPIWPSAAQGLPMQAHWGIDDPAAANPEDWADAFTLAYGCLETRAKAFVALPFENMLRAELQTEVDKIGALSQ